jgi:hypothetical protein
MTTTLSNFIGKHRDRFTNKHDNIFTLSFGKVFRRLGFLKIIQARYAEASAAFIANCEATRKALPAGSGPQPVSQDTEALLKKASHITRTLHLESESFYLFAKIILDDVARAIEYYFGAQRGLALDSHDDLTERMPRYAAAKGLTISEDLVTAATDLRKRISDFRDSQIAHEKSPRTMYGTSWSPSEGARIVTTRIFPKTTDPDPAQNGMEALPELRKAIDAYLDQVAAFLSANEDKTNLQLLNAAPEK